MASFIFFYRTEVCTLHHPILPFFFGYAQCTDLLYTRLRAQKSQCDEQTLKIVSIMKINILKICRSGQKYQLQQQSVYFVQAKFALSICLFQKRHWLQSFYKYLEQWLVWYFVFVHKRSILRILIRNSLRYLKYDRCFELELVVLGPYLQRFVAVMYLIRMKETQNLYGLLSLV